MSSTLDDEINNKINIIFETLESHIHLIEHAQEGIEKLFERIENIELYFDEVKKLINKVYYQEGLLQGFDLRIIELDKYVADLIEDIGIVNYKIQNIIEKQ